MLLLTAEKRNLETVGDLIQSGAVTAYVLQSLEDAAVTIQNLSEKCPYDVVIIDGLTELYSMGLDEIRTQKDEYAPWKIVITLPDRGIAAAKLENVYRWALQMIPVTLVFTVIEEGAKKRGDGDVEEWDTGPALPGKGRYRWAPLCTELYRTMKWADETGKTVYGIATESDGSFPAGSRYRARGISIKTVEPNLAVILGKIGVKPTQGDR